MYLPRYSMLKMTLERYLRRSLSRVYSHSSDNLSVYCCVIYTLIIYERFNTEDKLKKHLREILSFTITICSPLAFSASPAIYQSQRVHHFLCCYSRWYFLHRPADADRVVQRSSVTHGKRCPPAGRFRVSKVDTIVDLSELTSTFRALATLTCKAKAGILVMVMG